MLFENTWIMGPLIFYGMGGLFILEGKMCVLRQYSGYCRSAIFESEL